MYSVKVIVKTTVKTIAKTTEAFPENKEGQNFSYLLSYRYLAPY